MLWMILRWIENNWIAPDLTPNEEKSWHSICRMKYHFKTGGGWKAWEKETYPDDNRTEKIFILLKHSEKCQK